MARQYFIVVGDTTTAGGTVLTGSPFLAIQSVAGDLRSQAFVGDVVECAMCGPTRIVNGVPHVTFNGCAAAVDGSDLACGHKLASTQQRLTWVGEEPAAGSEERPSKPGQGPTAVAPPQIELDSFDEAFILISKETGKPLANRKYRIVRGEAIESGVTDADGATQLIVSESAESLAIFLQEEGP